MQTGMGNLLLEVFRLLDSQVPEQAIDVPKIPQDRIQQRLVDRDLRHAQLAEQLVEMPEFVQFASLLQQQRAEQIVDNPVPRGRRVAVEVFKVSLPEQKSFSRSADEVVEGSSWTRSLTCPLCATTGTVVAQFNKVVDVPVVMRDSVQ